MRCTFLINSFRFIFRSAAPLCAARSLSLFFFLFFFQSVKRLKKRELKEEKLVGRIISVLSSKAFTLGGKLEKCYLPRATVPSNSRSVSILAREASTFPPNVANLLAPAKIRIRNAVGRVATTKPKEYRIFPNGSSLLKHFGATDIAGTRGNDDKTIFRNSMEKRSRVKSRVVVP